MPARSRIILPHRHISSVSLVCQTDEIWWPDGFIVGYSTGGLPSSSVDLNINNDNLYLNIIVHMKLLHII